MKNFVHFWWSDLGRWYKRTTGSSRSTSARDCKVVIAKLSLLLSLKQSYLFCYLYCKVVSFWYFLIKNQRKTEAIKTVLSTFCNNCYTFIPWTAPRECFAWYRVFSSPALVNFVCKIDIRAWLALMGASRKLLKFRGTLNPSLSHFRIYNTCTSIFKVKFCQNYFFGHLATNKRIWRTKVLTEKDQTLFYYSTATKRVKSIQQLHWSDKIDLTGLFSGYY